MYIACRDCHVQVSGMGPTCYVHLAETTKTPKKSKSKSSMTEVDRGRKEGIGERKNVEDNNITAATAQPTGIHFHEGASIAGWGDVGVVGTVGQVDGTTGGAGTGLSSDEASIYMDMPELVEDLAVAKNDDCESTCSTSSSGIDSAAQEDEGKRLMNETRRLLLMHQEHAMTLTELLESFQHQEEPTNLTVQSLYKRLEVLDGDSNKKFQVQCVGSSFM